nr:uncharacterized protein LOC124491101 [Dermatophagoides farinae]
MSTTCFQAILSDSKPSCNSNQDDDENIKMPALMSIPDVPNGNITAPPIQNQTSITVVDESSNSPPININRIFSHPFNNNISNGSPLFNNSSKFFGQTPPSSIQLPIDELSKHSIKEPIKITVKITLLDSIEVQWESVLINEILYVYISQPPTGNSKEAFIALLEFAEEELHCKKVVVYLDKQNPDRNVMIRLFNFIGFVLLPPDHPAIPANGSDDMVYMAYDIFG